MNEKHDAFDSELEQHLSQMLEGASNRPGAGIPDRVDRAVLALADGTARRIRQAMWRDRARRYARYAAALAASVAILVGVTWRLTDRQPPSPARHVDIVDAYLLAQALRAGETTAAHDHNGDGRVDAADVDHVARMAVSLAGAPTEEGTEDA